jgi:uncharacterized protein (TIGR03382 family)
MGLAVGATALLSLLLLAGALVLIRRRGGS